jgi:hypothetical protein
MIARKKGHERIGFVLQNTEKGSGDRDPVPRFCGCGIMRDVSAFPEILPVESLVRAIDDEHRSIAPTQRFQAFLRLFHETPVTEKAAELLGTGVPCNLLCQALQTSSVAARKQDGPGLFPAQNRVHGLRRGFEAIGHCEIARR